MLSFFFFLYFAYFILSLGVRSTKVFPDALIILDCAVHAYNHHGLMKSVPVGFVPGFYRVARQCDAWAAGRSVRVGLMF